MQKYVIGFIFDSTRDLVLLIEKINPAWQRGRLNGVGGKIEEGEEAVPRRAMARETLEETGLLIPEEDWVSVATLFKDEEFIDYVYYTVYEDIFEAESMEEEQVKVVSTREAILGRLNTLHNIPLLIQQCSMVREMYESAHGWVAHPNLVLHYPKAYEHNEKMVN